MENKNARHRRREWNVLGAMSIAQWALLRLAAAPDSGACQRTETRRRLHSTPCSHLTKIVPSNAPSKIIDIWKTENRAKEITKLCENVHIPYVTKILNDSSS